MNFLEATPIRFWNMRGHTVLICRTMRMSHHRERADSARLQNEYDRAPRHGLNLFVGRCLFDGPFGIVTIPLFP
jgi:hypothetical protein